MLELAISIVIGIALIAIGIFNIMGYLGMLHSYHVKRVSEQDKKPFGRLVGAGMIVIGVSVIVSTSLFYAYEKLGNRSLNVAGSIVMISGFVIGLGLSFYAMIKYNKGIF